MTGAGSASLAFALEQSFLGDLRDEDSDGNTDYYKFGRNPQLDELDLDRQLERLVEDGVVESVDSIAGKVDGAVGVTAVVSKDTFGEVLDWVFNDGGTAFTDGLAQTGRIFAGVDYIGGTCERELEGVTPVDFEIAYDDENNTVTYSVSFLYADESNDSTIDPTSITGPTDGNDVPFHGFSLDIDGTTVSKLSTTTLSISNISRYQWGASEIAEEAVMARPESTLDATAIFSGPSRLELAYGGSGSSSPQASMSSVTGTVTLSVGGSDVATFSLPKLKPATYSWSDLIGEADLTDPTTFHVNGGVSVSTP
ncbi:hypothetical protein G9C85_02655 [Halorubellus sp. JP-L1]|uniref:hypothetical protein n=1 Tax=Halorubellus sp. JP-L1 TaxID=2715753 RepID=UPI00140CA72F|nr:hypothetical protein [Halorubellus sp. JP-L1]NHN40539.1 hypothetical protein [Halorubellus sp. JP-L1]